MNVVEPQKPAPDYGIARRSLLIPRQISSYPPLVSKLAQDRGERCLKQSIYLGAVLCLRLRLVIGAGYRVVMRSNVVFAE